MRRLVVIDANVYVSRFLNPRSQPGRAVAKALEADRILVSTATLMELREVLRRPRFAPYIPPDSIGPFLERILSVAIYVEIHGPIRACRDPKDDKFLELAVDGRADAIVTGDSDLLELHPFRGIAILTPADYLKLK
jgi:putative PIN family toxin of toxin-antitoxin system